MIIILAVKGIFEVFGKNSRIYTFKIRKFEKIRVGV